MRKPMTRFVCVKCGHGSMVRSNFKFTPNGNPYCKAEEACDLKQGLQKSAAEHVSKRQEERE